MSKQSYVEGFRKAAEAQGVDPYALYDLVVPMRKKAQSGGIWDSVMERINAAKAWYDKPENANLRPLVNAGIGAVGLGALNKLLGGSFGRGAVLGGIGGAATGVDWKALSTAIGTKAKENAQAKANSKAKPE